MQDLQRIKERMIELKLDLVKETDSLRRQEILQSFEFLYAEFLLLMKQAR